MNVIFICHYHSQISQLCHIFKGSISDKPLNYYFDLHYSDEIYLVFSVYFYTNILTRT